MHTRKSAFQKATQATGKEDKRKIKKRIRKERNSTELSLSSCTYQNTTNNILDKMADSSITFRKGKVFSPKIENTYMETDKPIDYVSETECHNNSLSVSNKFKELKKKQRSSVISSRSQKFEQMFDELIESNSGEKIILVDKNKTKQTYNLTSDSEDENCTEETIQLRSGLCLFRKCSAESTKHGRANNRVNYDEKQFSKPKDKVIKKARRRPGKKFVKSETEVKQSKSNTVPRNEIIDEIMRKPSEIINTSLEITTLARTLTKNLEPFIEEIRMEPIVDDLDNDEHVETIISEQKYSKNKNNVENALSLKNEKVVTEIASSLVIKNNENGKSASPFPELVVENVATNRNDCDDPVSAKKIQAWIKMYVDSEYDNAENKTENLPPDTSKINKTCDTINKTSVICVDKQNIIECHHTVEEKPKEVTRSKTSKIKEPNVEVDSEIIQPSESTSRLDKSMVTDGDWSENAHSNLKPPSIGLLEEKIEPRDLELQDLPPSSKEYFLKIRKNLYHTSDSHKSPVTDNEKEHNDNRIKRKGIRRLSRKIKKPSSLKNLGSNENNKTVTHKTNEISKHDQKEESLITSSQSVKRKNEDVRQKINGSKETLDNKINKYTHESLMSPINSYSNNAQLKVANISNLNNYEKIYPSRNGSSVGNAASDESYYTPEDDNPQLARKKTRNYEEILDGSTATEKNRPKRRKFDANTARYAASTISQTVNRWLEHNAETIAVTPENNIGENIKASLEKLETTLDAFDNRTCKTISQIFLNVPKQIRQAQEKKQILMKDLDEKFKEINKQTIETTQESICNILCENVSNNRKLILQQLKDLKALYRLISKKT